MGVYGGNSSIVGVKITNDLGVPLIGSLSIPEHSSQVIIHGGALKFYIAYSEGDLDSDFSRFLWPSDTMLRLILPPGVGQLFFTAVEPSVQAEFVSVWLA